MRCAEQRMNQARMADRRGSRFVLEALFLVVLAVALALAKLRRARDRRDHAARLAGRRAARVGGLARRAALRQRAAAALLRPVGQPAAGPAARAGAGRLPPRAPGRGGDLDRPGRAARGGARRVAATRRHRRQRKRRTPNEPVVAAEEAPEAPPDRWTLVELPAEPEAAPIALPEPEPDPDRRARARAASPSPCPSPQPEPEPPGGRRAGSRPGPLGLRHRALQPRPARRAAGRRRFGRGGGQVADDRGPCPPRRPAGAARRDSQRPQLAVREVALAASRCSPRPARSR